MSKFCLVHIKFYNVINILNSVITIVLYLTFNTSMIESVLSSHVSRSFPSFEKSIELGYFSFSMNKQYIHDV